MTLTIVLFLVALAGSYAAMDRAARGLKKIESRLDSDRWSLEDKPSRDEVAEVVQSFEARVAKLEAPPEKPKRGRRPRKTVAAGIGEQETPVK